MASIEKRSENTYRIIASAGYDINGKKLRKYKTVTLPSGMTERQREKELNHQAVLFEELVQSGQFLDGGTRFRDFADKWITDYSERQHKAQTIMSNREALKRINLAIGHIRLSKLQRHHILEYLYQLEEPGQNKKTGGGLSAKTISNHLRVLSSILSTAVEWGIISNNPAKGVFYKMEI